MSDDANAVVHLYAGQVWTIGHKVVRYGGQLRRHVDAGQLLTRTEGAIIHAGDAVGQGHRGEPRIGKAIDTRLGERRLFSQVHLRQLRTVLESIVVNAGGSFCQHHLLQLVAVVENAARHLFDVGREAELGQRVATLESVILQLRQTLRQYKGFDGITVAERIAANGL